MKYPLFSARVTLLLVSLFVSLNIKAQQFFGKPFQHVHDEKCAAVHMEKIQEEMLGIYGSKDFFEAWMTDKIEEARKKPKAQQRTADTKRVIPVVVHVIHSGTPVGVGANIPKSQIESQIRILTEDFRRLNADANQTPAEFLSVAADANIEFVLAKQDPRGLPTDGIVRVQGPLSAYSPSDASLISQLSSWPQEDYMNIWVVPLVSPFLGYATFPVSNLPGLNFSPSARELEGITVDYRYFGIGGNALPGTAGRTATHEVGHFFGLRHIWGDGDCSVDDFVTDTPNQDAPNNICRLTTSPRFSCNNRNMTENYMDYTADACMNLFTRGQVERMDVVLANSPRRASLVNGRATLEPVLLPNDLALGRIINPQNAVCSGTVTPGVEVFNAGENRITSAKLQVKLNGLIIENKEVSLNLTTGQTTTVTFNPINLAPTTNSFEVSILEVNSSADPTPLNNILSSSPRIQTTIALPYNFRFADLNDSWTIDNPDGSFTWEPLSLNIDGSSQQVLRIRHYEYDANGQLDYLVSPQINLSQFPNAQLTFNLAYGPYDAAGFTDFLYVAVSTDCGNTFNILNAPYSKDRTYLQTTNATLDEFVPFTNAQFRREIVNLNQFAGAGDVRVAFITRNGFGNNIFIKDIEVLTNETFNYNARLNALITPNPVTNGDHTQELISITNTGNLPLDGFIFRRQTGTNSPQTFIARGAALAPGASVNLTLPKSTTNGVNRLAYTMEAPGFDQNRRDPIQLNRFVLTNTETARSPWRQTFNNTVSLTPWVTINPENNLIGWQVSPLVAGTASENVIRLQPSSGDNSYWLGSPIFDLSKSPQAAVFFDIAAGIMPSTAVFRVLASNDGGNTYQEVMRKTGSEISTVNSLQPNPNNRGDFRREYINLTAFAGRGKDKARLAFVLEGVSAEQGAVFMDNLELFLSANREPVNPGLGNTIIYPNPARSEFNIAFNLNTYEAVNIKIISPTGALVHDVDYPNTLNQTYTFRSETFSKGLFIVQITSQSITETRKLFIQ